MSSAFDRINPRADTTITIVFRDLTPEELEPFMGHPKAIYFGWCHAPKERDEAREELSKLTGFGT
jgi:hypothetical protein